MATAGLARFAQVERDLAIGQQLAEPRDLLGGYRYPKVLAYVGLVVWLLTIYLGYESFSGIVDLWQQ